MLEYTILQDDFISGLQAQVTEAVAQGWRPQGGVAVVHIDVGSTQFPNHYAFRVLYLQAMVREGKRTDVAMSYTIADRGHTELSDSLSTGTWRPLA